MLQERTVIASVVSFSKTKTFDWGYKMKQTWIPAIRFSESVHRRQSFCNVACKRVPIWSDQATTYHLMGKNLTRKIQGTEARNYRGASDRVRVAQEGLSLHATPQMNIRHLWELIHAATKILQKENWAVRVWDNYFLRKRHEMKSEHWYHDCRCLPSDIDPWEFNNEDRFISRRIEL